MLGKRRGATGEGGGKVQFHLRFANCFSHSNSEMNLASSNKSKCFFWNFKHNLTCCGVRFRRVSHSGIGSKSADAWLITIILYNERKMEIYIMILKKKKKKKKQKKKIKK